MKMIFLFLLVLLISCNKTSNDSISKNLCNDQGVVTSKNGYTKNFYPNSINLKSIGHYAAGKKDGFWKFFL